MEIKAKLKDGIVSVKAMAKHPMLTYDVAAKQGLEANFITHMTATVNNKVVLDMSTSQFLSKNPIVKFTFKGAAVGDKIVMTWVDLKGDTETSESIIK
ncbi:MAG: thiosulfate oxidation carrier complex protein SoxZ [Sulfuricurvum sp.]|nr:thiosulfate oxidation carrier complex protein SoxZ [Sulfuricurvum sp.]MDD5386032.1 thiosulfate oxidation carrier complex protein SoxZ [Sulfuricurvum sp.]